MQQSNKFNSVKYRKLGNIQDDDSNFVDSQFEVPSPKVPWKAISLAAFLCFGGTTLLILGVLLITGHINDQYADRTWPFITLGMLMFLPGFYHVRIAYFAFKGYSGYSFDDIPEFD